MSPTNLVMLPAANIPSTPAIPGAPEPRLRLADTTCRWASGGYSFAAPGGHFSFRVGQMQDPVTDSGALAGVNADGRGELGLPVEVDLDVAVVGAQGRRGRERDTVDCPA